MKILALFFAICNLIFAIEPMLLKDYKGDENLSGWVMSEKLDGVRALWDGKELKSRNNLAFTPPKEWLACFPKAASLALDGELYTKRGDFERISSIVNSANLPMSSWSEMKFYVFDLPYAEGNLLARLKKLRYYLDSTPCAQIVIINQLPATTHENVQKFLDVVVNGGGEGVVVRDGGASYESGRSDKILKLKKFKDSECEIIKINGGKGKFSAVMGSVVCKDINSGVIFKIGSGFSDKLRQNPPKIGEIITYKYQSLSKTNTPRFPVFLRIKSDF